MRIAARFLIAVLIVLVLAGIALFFLRKPIVAAAAERILRGVGLEAPEVAVDEVSLTRLDVARLEAGGGAERGLDLRDVALFYDWRALLFDGKIRSIEISGGRVVAAFDDAGGMNIAGWSPDPNVKPAPPPFKTLKVGALDVIARTPKGDARLDTAGAFDYADGGEFTARERAAIHFAEKMALDHHNIGDEDVARMRALFSDAEFLELAMMTGQYIGFGRVLAMLQLEVAACPV